MQGVPRIEAVVGQNVRTRRAELGLSGDRLGQLLAPLLGKPWSRQAVSAAEKGARAWMAADLIAVATVLGVTLSDLLTPPADIEAVSIGGAEPMARADLLTITGPIDMPARLRADAAIAAAMLDDAHRLFRSVLSDAAKLVTHQ